MRRKMRASYNDQKESKLLSYCNENIWGALKTFESLIMMTTQKLSICILHIKL